MLSSSQKGAIAEAAIVHAALRLGIDVYRPVSEGGRFDLVFHAGGEFVRVQCKWATRAGDVLSVRCYSSRRGPEGFRQRSYTAAEVDLIVAYCADLDECYLLPMSVFSGRSCVQLRLAPARNNQTNGVHWAADHGFDALHWREHFAGP